MASRICARSSAQTERHRLTSWWPVALMGVIEVSAEKWSKTKQRKWGTAVECHQGNPHPEQHSPSSKACSSNDRLWSWPKKSIDAEALRARGTKRRDILALLDLLCLRVSASVEMSPSPYSTAGTSIGPETEQRWDWPKSPLIQHVEQYILDSYSMGACTVAPTPSSHDVRPTSNSVPEQPGAQESLNSVRPAGSPDEPKHNSPMMPSSSGGARWLLAYGKYEWPPYYSSKQKANEEWRKKTHV